MTLESRDRWTRAAEGWEARADKLARDTMPVAARMVEPIAPQPGQTILELAAGVGDTGFLAAELIEPGGTLITSDFVPEMLTAAQRRAERKGIKNVRFRQMDMNVPIDLPAASLDGVLGRWAYMLSTTASPRCRTPTDPEAERQGRAGGLDRPRRQPVERRARANPAERGPWRSRRPGPGSSPGPPLT